MNRNFYNYIPLNKYYWIYFLTVGISVFIYGKYRCVNKDYKDILALELYPKIDGWLISHFVAFAIAGVLFPDTFYFSLLLGILWELFEFYLGITKPKFLKGITDCHRVLNENTKKNKDVLNLNNDDNNGYWWYGKKEDVLVDALGFLFGKYVILKYFL